MRTGPTAGSAVSDEQDEESWWSGDPSQLSLLEIAAAAGIPVSTAQHCGKEVCLQFERRYGRSALPPKQMRGEPVPSRVYPAADTCWIQQLLSEHSRRRAQQQREKAIATARCPACGHSSTTTRHRAGRGCKRRLQNPQCECCASGPAISKRRKLRSSSTRAPASVLLTHRIGSAYGPWTPTEAVELAGAVQAEEVNATCHDGCTAAYRLAKWGYTSAVAELAAQGANLDAQTRSGRTALMAATLQCQVPVIRLLLARGVDPAVRDTAGQTALDHARERVVDGWRRNCSVAHRFDAEATLHVLEEWHGRRSHGAVDVEPEAKADVESLAHILVAEPQATKAMERATFCGVNAKAVIWGMRVRDAKRMRTARAKRWPPFRETQFAAEPEPEPEGLQDNS